MLLINSLSPRAQSTRTVENPMKTRTNNIAPSLILGLLAAFALVLASCIQESSSVTGTISIPNGLGMGGSDDGIMVELLEVTNDSRCAEGVECVQQGKADVRLGVTVDGGTEETVVIEVVPGQTASHKFDRFEVEILRLLPEPPPVGGVEQNQYQLELRISED